jgi:hypothetical protein
MNTVASRLVRACLAAGVGLAVTAGLWAAPAGAARPASATQVVPAGVIPFVYPTLDACNRAGFAIFETIGRPVVNGWHCDPIPNGWQLTIL